MKRFLPVVVIISVCILVVPVMLIAPQPKVAAAPMVTGAVVMVARDVVDLKWDPTQYNDPKGEPFVRWELWRGTASTAIDQRIRVGFDTYTDFYRDEGLELNQTYYYRLDVVRYDASNEVNVSYVFFTTSITTGALWGTVYEDLVLGAHTYEMGGYIGYKYASWIGVVVTNDATLSIDSSTTINRGEVSNAYALCADKGRIEIDGAKFKDISVYFGNPNDENSWGSGWVRGATGVDVGVFGESKDIDVIDSKETGVNLEHSSTAYIENNTGVSSVWLQDISSAVIISNTISYTVRLEDQASAVIQDRNVIKGVVDLYGAAKAEIYGNYLYSRVTVSGYGGPEDRNAHATIIGNTLELPYQHDGISVSYDASAIIKQNSIEWTGYHDGESSVLLDMSGDKTRVTAERNHLINGKITVYGGSTITVTENVLTGDGSAITVGCIVCGTTTQAKGKIEKNTVQNGWGFELWAGSESSELSIKHNCIRGNNPGLTLQDYFMEKKVDMTENWWGHIKGPYHPTINPTGLGDPIEGDKVIVYPWDETDEYCRDVPDQSPPSPAFLFVEADPEELIPDGSSITWIYAKLRDEYGGPVVGAEVSFSLSPDLGKLLSQTCTSGFDGQCKVQYQSPDPDSLKGEKSVRVEAKGGNLSTIAEISFIYLNVENALPLNGSRNIDWENASVYAYFDREINPTSVNSENFKITSLQYYQNGIPCRYDTSITTHVWCWLDDLKDLQKYPDADIGLMMKATLLGGLKGIRGKDGTFLRQDYVWVYYTTPKLTPRIIPVQVSEEAPLLGNTPAVVRVHAGLDEFTELDWVEADVTMQYQGGAMGSYERQKVRFYPGEAGDSTSVLTGNSANFYSSKGEVPIVATGQFGTFKLTAEVQPTQQTGYPSTGPREFTAQGTVEVRNIQAEVWPFEYHLYPVTPAFYPPNWSPAYPWHAGQKIDSLRNSQIVLSGRFYLERLLPLREIKFEPHFTVLETSSPIDNVSLIDWHFLSGWLRRMDTVFTYLQHVVMVVPKDWMSQINSNDPIFQGSSNNVCIIAEDASAASIPQCIGRLYGLESDQPAAPTLRGYDLARDRYVNSQVIPDYNFPMMSSLLLRKPANSVWIDVANYNELMDEFTDLSVTSLANVADADLQSITETATMMVGGEIVKQDEAETGLIDVVLLPSTDSKIINPEESGDYQLQFLNNSGVIQATHSFTPEFITYEGDTKYTSFLFNLIVPVETRQIKLLNGSVVLHTKTASANAPQIKVSKPSAGAYEGEIYVAWSSSDVDGSSDLRFSVLYSQDAGLTWQPIALWTSAESVSLDTAEFSNCQSCMIKVIAHDGFHAAEAQSALFSVNNPPLITWVWPANGYREAGRLTEVVAVFRDPMGANTIGTSSFTLQDQWGNKISGTVTYDDIVHEALLIPNEALSYGRSYTARLDSSIKDALGQSIGSDVQWTFRVELGPFPVYLPLISGG